jgi:spore coat protein CotH
MKLHQLKRGKAALIIALCLAAALLAVLSGIVGIDDIKYTAKIALRGYVDPAKLDTGLPVVRITTADRKPITSKEVYVSADIEITDPDNSAHNFAGEVEIRGRGNTTWGAPKKPYRLRFPKKTSLFGYEKARNWVLLANYQDTTLMTNALAFELGRRFGLPFTPHVTYVDVILNGRYVGNYTLTEQIQVGAGRIDINGAGSFLVELDNHYDEEPKFQTPLLELPVMIKHPEDREDSGYGFVKDAVNELEAALYSGAYRDLIDMDVFIDYIMINEITRNVDIQFPHSVYLYRDGGENRKMQLGPLWDFDYGFDYQNGVYFNEFTGMYLDTSFREGPGQKFFSRFFEDPRFRAKYKERWNEKYAGIAAMETFIDETAALLEKSRAADSKIYWWKALDYKKEIERLKGWWRKRIAYLNREINEF